MKIEHAGLAPLAVKDVDETVGHNRTLSVKLKKPSKLYFQQKLKLARRSRSYRSCIQGQIYQAEVGSRNEAIRAGKLRTVEDVEHFGPELNFCLFFNRKAFGQRRINLPDSGTSQKIAGYVAES